MNRAPQATWTFEIPIRVYVDALPDGWLEYDLDAGVPGAGATTGDLLTAEARFVRPVAASNSGGGSSGIVLFVLLVIACVRRRVRDSLPFLHCQDVLHGEAVLRHK